MTDQELIDYVASFLASEELTLADVHYLGCRANPMCTCSAPAEGRDDWNADVDQLLGFVAEVKSDPTSKASVISRSVVTELADRRKRQDAVLAAHLGPGWAI